MEYRIHRGGLARPVKGAEAKRKITRLMHGAAASLTVEPTHADWQYDLRRGRLRIYGGLLRYLDLAMRQGRTKDELKMIPRWIEAYIDEQYEPTNTAELKLVG